MPLNKHGDNMRLWLISDRATEESTRGRIQFADWQERDVAVPVKPCKHKRIDSHWVESVDSAEEIHSFYDLRQAIHREWCPGAGIGETP